MIKKKLSVLVKEINSLTLPNLIISVLSGILGILWPIAGIVLFLLSLFTEEKVYGKLAAIGAFSVMITTILGFLFMN